jgi:hypothetical protein
MTPLETIPESVLFNPEYQNTLSLIEDAMRVVGKAEPAKDALPDIFDEQLIKLIESVPME